MVSCVVGGIFFAQMLVRSGSPMNVPLAERVANDFKDKPSPSPSASSW